MKPYYQDDRVTLYHGDALAILPQLEAGAAQAVLTDPPYSSGGMVRGDRMASTQSKYVQTDSMSGKQLNSFSGDNRDQRAFLLWSNLWISSALKVVTEGAIIGSFTDWRQLPTMTDALQIGGAVWRGVVPWHKPNGRNTQGRFANNCEYFVWGTNGPRTRELDQQSETLGGFWQENTPRERVHQTQKPIALMQWLARCVLPGETILDPFAGSGSTLIAASAIGRKAIGVELDERNCEIIAKRLSQENFDFGALA